MFYGKVVPDEILLAGCDKATVINASNFDGRDLFCRVCEVGVRSAEYMNTPIASQDADGVIFVVSMTGYCQAVHGYFPKVSTALRSSRLSMLNGVIEPDAGFLGSFREDDPAGRL